MRIRPALLSALAISFFGVASTHAHAAGAKACDLLTKQIATTLLGAPPSSPPLDTQGIGCSYSIHSVTVGLVIADAGARTGDEFVQSLVRAYPHSEKESGLCEGGAWISVGGDSYGVMALCHHKTVRLGVTRKLTPELKDQMVQAMRQMLEKF